MKPTLPRLALYFRHLGATGFGGPIALAARMQKALVDEREWYSRQDFLDGLALEQLSPGPLAAQLAMYLGAIHRGVFGPFFAPPRGAASGPLRRLGSSRRNKTEPGKRLTRRSWVALYAPLSSSRCATFPSSPARMLR